MKRAIYAIWMSAALIFAAGCTEPAQTGSQPDGQTQAPQLKPVGQTEGTQVNPNSGLATGKDTEAEQPKLKGAGKTIEEASMAALLALKQKEMKKLAGMAHPNKGIRFSPYGHIDQDKDLTFLPAQLEKLAEDQTVYKWGAYDGSGEPIELKFSDYYARFIFDADFTEAKQKAYNTVIGKGNTLVNIAEVYPAPGHEFSEYHFPGFDPKYEGMDWKSLRLVYEKMDGQYYLVGVIHDQWTI